ncbi:MAG TPA: TolC family protein [Bryobacteraceae bacterium]|nr:TolC family protein [Bryobacteraceae bacterium]
MEADRFICILVLTGAMAYAQQPSPPPVKITLEQAMELAARHNHSLQAARTTITQNLAEEVTANLRPNPSLAWDSQFLPLFNLPQLASADYFNTTAQFDFGVGYTIERGKKRQNRLQAAKDVTAVSRSQVLDNERTLSFNVAQQFIAVLLAESTLDLANQDLKSYQQTIDISEARVAAGDMSEGDLIRIKLQLLQFQQDVSAAKLSRVQALAALRQLLGFESVPENYDVEGALEYKPVTSSEDQLKSLAMQSRPDLTAARQSIIAANSQVALAKANGKKDLGVSFNYSHVGAENSAAFFFNMDIPLFDRNQGEIARTQAAVTQANELYREASEQISSDVVTAWEGLKTNDEIIGLFRSGYLDQTTQSRDISEYAYQHGAAPLLDFLDAERSYRANQLAYRQALAAWMVSLEQLRSAVGTRNLP